MDISLSDLKELIGNRNSQSHSLQVGKRYFIRTLSCYYTGKLVAVTDSDLVLADAAWIPDTGRFADALSSGNFAEVEPYPKDVIVSRGVVCDISEFNHQLPRSQK